MQRSLLANVETNEAREVTTNNEGDYSIPQLQAASYTLKVEAPGFKTASIEGVKIAVQINRTVDVTLEVGAIGDTVMVSAENGPVLQTETPAQSAQRY